MTHTKPILAVLGLLALVTGLAPWFQWRQDEPRRACLSTIHLLEDALASPAPASFSQLVILGAPQSSRTPAEQNEFIRKALADELSAEGLAVLQRKGAFGHLTSLFPAEAQVWATQAGVRAVDCLAFRLDRTNGLRSEVVLTCGSGSAGLPAFRIVRLNNVKQLAESKLVIAEQRQ